jgi:putative ABC transport system ATP-binding protein
MEHRDRFPHLENIMKNPVLEATDLYRFFHVGDDETLALRGVSMTVAAGEIVAITGPSGSGKSTLLSCLAGLDEPDAGMVRVAGNAMSRRSETERASVRAHHVGVVFQTNNLLDHLSLEMNIVVAQRLVRAADGQPALVSVLLDELGLAHRRLSGGEAARAGLAVALANNPAVIVADEPTGELDSLSAGRVLTLLKQRAAGGAAVVIVTHSPAVAGIADRELRLKDGLVVESKVRI